MSHPKPKKKPKASSLTRKLDIDVRKLVMKRDKACILCGDTNNLEASHYIGRANYGVRWDLRNVHMMCRSCHRDYHDNNPKYQYYMANKYGDDIFETLYIAQKKHIERGGFTASEKEELHKELIGG